MLQFQPLGYRKVASGAPPSADRSRSPGEREEEGEGLAAAVGERTGGLVVKNGFSDWQPLKAKQAAIMVKRHFVIIFIARLLVSFIPSYVNSEGKYATITGETAFGHDASAGVIKDAPLAVTCWLRFLYTLAIPLYYSHTQPI